MTIFLAITLVYSPPFYTGNEICSFFIKTKSSLYGLQNLFSLRCVHNGEKLTAEKTRLAYIFSHFEKKVGTTSIEENGNSFDCVNISMQS